MKRLRTIKLNPAPEGCGGRKPADQVTDRALRYRANSDSCRPGGPKRCLWCGVRESANATAKRPGVEVAHIDGNESNTAPENLAWTCRSCNQKVAAVMKRAGVGRPTNQYNPGDIDPKLGAKNWKEFSWALSRTAGDINDGSLQGAIDKLHNTSTAKRSRFQKEIWERRKRMYGPSGRKDGGAVPF